MIIPQEMIVFLKQQNRLANFNAVKEAEQIFINAKYEDYDPESARAAVRDYCGLGDEVADIPEWLLFWLEYTVRERIEREVIDRIDPFWELETFTINPARFADDPIAVARRWMERHQVREPV